ncbi:MAG TPA: helix-turn-helix transcriptional regulator [Arsenophonus nasoniae]|uniref:Helix-turn-helix transcriptional regulator n=1 Tax=Arsenophonus nasoniae TaxID=638 RepID=A0AA95K768_9GAMM|nr:helix-turn-helix transcriptional regulator [Arsenophonus nasoniae]WGL94637.1 helix-turn-helix transcriptional regulator [Arsenophonus nasoniae]
MSTPKNEKLKLIRESERLKIKEMADLTGINYHTYHGYESGKMNMSLESAEKLFSITRFRKYMDWFMFDEINPEAGQIAPVLSLDGQSKTISTRSDKKIG